MKTFLFTLFILAALGVSAQRLKQPNIVLFIADDLGWNDIQPYSSKVVRTPNLAKLAAQSLLFTNAFASSPTCTPSRSTIFTGLMPVRHGAHGNHGVVDYQTKSLAQYLQPLNYQVAIAGKLHVGPEEVFTFERIANTNVPEPGFEKKPGLHYDLDIEPVDTWLAAKHDKPFMLIVADHSPHVIWPEKATYAADAVDIPAQHIDTKQTRASRARYYTDITKMDGNVGKLLASLQKNKLDDNTIVVFISDQGPQWPFAKWSLYDYGVKSPLLVRWPGTVKAASKTKALVSFADLLPTFVEIAGGTPPADIDGKSFLKVIKGQSNTHRDFVFATHTGDGMMNRSPARMIRSMRYKYILNIAPEILYTTHMDRAKDHDGGREYWDSWRERSFTDEHAASVLWRYHNHPKEEFYDMVNDPLEMHNLAADPQFASIIQDYRGRLSDWRKQQNDFFIGPEDLTKPSPVNGKTPTAPYVF